MNKIVIFIYIIIFIITSSCQEVKRGLGFEKVRPDEFLIEKRSSLELPPDYNEIPKPNSKSKERITTDQKLKKILKVPSEKSNKVINKSSSIEESILNKINK